jgi:hypothetical protein
MNGLIILAILVLIMVVVPPTAVIILPFILISTLTGLAIQSLGKSIRGE